MSNDPRPRIDVGNIVTYVTLLIVGVAIFWFSFGPERYVLDRAAVGPSRPASAATDFFLKKDATAGLVVLGALGTAMITVCLFELLKLLVQYIVWMVSKRRRINAFFGEGAASHSAAAEVHVQSDKLSVVLQELVQSDPALAQMPKNRLYKARSWINRFDAEAGRQILKLFRDEGLDAPSLKFVDRERPGKPDNMPFKVFLGLRADGADKLLERGFENWLRIVYTAKGDGISIKKSLLPGDWESRLDGTPAASADGFLTLSPTDWDLESWLSGSKAVRDYALILRHAGSVGDGTRPCVYFWLAGFTERGTYAAGRYLAANWEALHRRFVAPQKTASSAGGDFMLMIEGPSHDKDTRELWSEIPGFEVTPALLSKKNISSLWATRLKEATAR